MLNSSSMLLLFLLSGVNLILLVVLLKKSAGSGTSAMLSMVLRDVERLERTLREEQGKSREEAARQARDERAEMATSVRQFGDSLAKRLVEVAQIQKNQLDVFGGQIKTLTEATEQKLDRLREGVEGRLRHLQEDNNRKLEQMRATVDEKLHDTLEKRLGESFKLVSDRLEQVHKGLGEMQTLAAGVGDLKRVLMNVKTRGNFGEIQLHGLLEQILTADQYEANVITKPGSSSRVEFAIKLPGKGEPGESPVWLPIDAKFPQEDYLRLLEAHDRCDHGLIEEASKHLDRTVKEMARLICDKYLDPPHTTDFGIMFLPTEGLYAEVLRRPALSESIQREFKVIITGPTTLAALLNSLHLGFRTLAIERRSSEVWTLLGAVKTEFGHFSTILEKTRKKLQEAGNTIDTAARRTRVIERKLKGVQEISYGDAARLLEDEETTAASGDTE